LSSDYLVEKDLIDSLVVDCEGYICGRVGSFKVEPERILISLYGTEAKKVEVPDEEKLVENLISLVSAKKRSLIELHDHVRKELDLPSSQRITLKELMRFAGMKGVTIPTKMEEREERVDRGTVDWNLVDKVGTSDLGKCILLKEPVEAMRRGVEIKDKVPYYGTEYLRGRTVIDASARIIGSAEKILLRIGAPPGLSIRLERVSRIELDDPDALIENLVPSHFKREIDLYKAVARDLNLKGKFTAEEVKNKYLITWARTKRIDVPKRYEERREVVKEVSIDWSDIKKIGDIIILKKTFEDLMKPPTHVPEDVLEEKEEPPERPEEATEPEEKAEKTEGKEDWWKEYLGT